MNAAGLGSRRPVRRSQALENGGVEAHLDHVAIETSGIFDLIPLAARFSFLRLQLVCAGPGRNSGWPDDCVNDDADHRWCRLTILSATRAIYCIASLCEAVVALTTVAVLSSPTHAAHRSTVVVLTHDDVNVTPTSTCSRHASARAVILV